jgi:hypothetical protein
MHFSKSPLSVFGRIHALRQQHFDPVKMLACRIAIKRIRNWRAGRFLNRVLLMLRFTAVTSKITERLLGKRPHKRAGQNQFDAAQAAEMAGISEGLLHLWVSSGHFKPSIELSAKHPVTGQDVLGWHRYLLTVDDVNRLRKLVEQTPKPAWVDDGEQKILTVAQVAAIWQVSDDTVRRVFEDEPDVIKLGDENPRGKHRRITLRIPRKVMERVQRRLSRK